MARFYINSYFLQVSNMTLFETRHISSKYLFLINIINYHFLYLKKSVYKCTYFYYFSLMNMIETDNVLNKNPDFSNLIAQIAENNSMKVTHVKPHGALNNMACENFEIANVIAKSIIETNQNLIFLVPAGSQMEKAGKKLNMKVATEIFADRNYEDDGNLVSRSKPHALITDPEVAKKHVIKMVKNQALNCFSGKEIPCDIDSVCVHGDGKSAVLTAKEIKEGLVKSGVTLRPLDKLKKFV